ncbi:hypothetical protein RND81_14G004900 [Saponaria officinalis]|uniref:Protein JASON n=1 Tax=Saponaria officinalis TaxID=3572 RepID=A0AAW1GJF0_SAPOF
MPVTYCDVFSSLWRSLLAMGCFFDCFRVRSDHHRRRPRPVSDSSQTSATEEVAGRIHLSSLFQGEEKDECVVKDRENLVRRVGRFDIDEGLLEEVKILKACGTLPETPAEIRKAVKFSAQLEESDVKMPPNALQSSSDTPSAIQTDEVLPETFESANSGTTHNVVESSPETPEQKKKVEFVVGTSEKLHVGVPSSMRKGSPYATPRTITDDMQTPGTVYATNMKSLAEGNGQIRSQYVNTVLNPIDSVCELEELKEEHVATPSPVVKSKENSVNEGMSGDITLSKWLKSLPPRGDGHNREAASIRKANPRKAPEDDRPIIGLVAAHWNEQEDTPHVPPKWWDGNGIPNSTTKYKEDQKVRWHATPFEERLEKALSEETCAPQRKPIAGEPISFGELEGQDTATSQLKTTPPSVVSF